MTLSMWPDTPGAGGIGGYDELTPIDLDMHELQNSAVFNVQPSGLILFADNMSVTTLARFTQLSEGVPVTPTIAANLMSYDMSGGDKNNIEQEGADITMPQFMVTVNINAVTHSGGDTNTYENIGVGVCKDSNNFMFALWRRKQTAAGSVSIQVKIAGVSNFRGDLALGSALVPPFDIGLSLVANSLVLWQRPNGGTWTKLTSFGVSGDKNMKTTSIVGWKPAMVVACQAAVQVTTKLTNFNMGYFGSVGWRDPVVVSNEDGSARVTGGNTVTLTATCEDTAASAYCAVFTCNLITRVLTQTGVIMIDRGGAKQNDNAAHIIAYDDGTFRFFITTWGDAGGAANLIQILQKNETVLNLLTGANLVSGMSAALNLPAITALGGAYDPHAVKIGATWYLAYVVGPVAINSFFPALATSADLAAWANVGSDPTSVLFEGTRIFYSGGSYWVLAASVNFTNVYDITSFAYQGQFRSLILAGGSSPPHPTLVRLGQYIYYITFDATLFGAVANTQGHFREFRARRYAINGSGVGT